MHYDMDSFFASVEIRDNKRYLGKPLVVGEGVVTTASYEARKYGIHSAMSTFQAKKLCPNLIVVPVNKEKYTQISNKIKELVLKITEKAEFIALDEGYLDVTDVIKRFSSYEVFARKFRERIFHHTRLTCSVGIGFNKLSAKLASNINKPNGQFIFNSQLYFVEYLKDKDVKIIQGVGKKLRELLNRDGIEKVSDIYGYTLYELVHRYGKSRGELLYLSARGIDYSEIEYKKATHSIGNENTYRYPLESFESIKTELSDIFNHSYERLRKKEFITRTVVLKIKFSDNSSITRSKTMYIPTDDRDILYENLELLLEEIEVVTSIRLLGVSFGNLIKKSIRQLSFF